MVLGTVFLLHAAVFAADWPQFRGPGASGLGSGTPPVEWNGESGKNILRKTAIPGLGYSSPIIWANRIFLTTAVPASGRSAQTRLGLYGDIAPVTDEGPQEYRIYCLDRKSGKVLWQQAAVTAAPKVKRHPKSSHANPTPATDGRHVVAFFGSEGLFTYDMNGKLLWKKDFGVLDSGYFQAPTAQWGFSSSPVIHEGMLLIQADVQKGSFLAALDVRSGKELWRTPRNDVPTFSTPAVAPFGDSARQVVVNGWKHIGGYDLKTGRELWKMAGTGDIPVPTPVSADGLVVITSAHGGGRPIYAVRQSNGEVAWKQDRAGNYMQTPLLHDGLGYFCFDNGVLSVYQLATGERLYQQRLGAGSSGFTSSPVAAGGRLYLTDETGHSFVVKLGREFQLLQENELGEPVMASPAVSDGVLFVRGRDHLFAIGSK